MTQRKLGRRGFLLGAAVLPAAALTGTLVHGATPSLEGGLLSPSRLRDAIDFGMAPSSSPSLFADARRSRRYFGTAARMDQISADPKLRQILVQNCGSITPEIHMKWNSLEWKPEEFNYAPVDDLIAFGRQHGIAVRGHTLIWDQSTPDWAKAKMLASRDWGLVEGHFSRTLSRYAPYVHDWDVVNEPIDTEAGENGLRHTTFHRAFGADYIPRALETARAHAPNARLLINDYGFDYDNPVDEARRRAFLKLLSGLKARGTPLDGVGLQAHLDMSKGPLAAGKLRDFLRAIQDLGLDISITELDVKEQDYSAPVDRRDQQVADAARRYLDVVLTQESVRGVSTWGLSDRFSWLSEGDGAGGPGDPDHKLPMNRGLPFDEVYRTKPLYWAVQHCLETCGHSGVAFRAPAAARNMA